MVFWKNSVIVNITLSYDLAGHSPDSPGIYELNIFADSILKSPTFNCLFFIIWLLSFLMGWKKLWLFFSETTSIFKGSCSNRDAFVLEFWLQGQYHLENLADFPKPISWKKTRNKKGNYKNDLQFSLLSPLKVSPYQLPRKQVKIKMEPNDEWMITTGKYFNE